MKLVQLIFQKTGRALSQTLKWILPEIDWAARRRELAPFLSILIVISTAFAVVFCKMELRRVGYSVLKLTRAERKMRDHQRYRMIQLAKITRPERLQAVAQNRLTLKRAESGQIIQMTERGIALKQ
jgi:cell division protein FtsL